MLEYSAFAAPELWEAYRASHLAEGEASKWRLRLREIVQAERASKRTRALERPKGPTKLQPHVPWI